MRDFKTYDLGDDYTLSVDWSEPMAQIEFSGEKIAGRYWYSPMGWPGPFSIHERVMRWGLRQKKTHRKMERRLAHIAKKNGAKPA